MGTAVLITHSGVAEETIPWMRRIAIDATVEAGLTHSLLLITVII